MSDTGGRLTLWGVEVFLAAAEEGSVSAAARRLGASPSAISQQITNLETVLGAELLNRSNRPMTLTPAGRMLRTRAQVIQSEAARARSEIAGLDLTRLGQLRLGMVEDFEASVTPTLIADMADSLSKTQFELQTGPSHRLLDKLEHRALDVVVAADLGPPAAWMDVRPLLRDPFVMVVPKGHGATLEALAALPYIEYTSRHAMGRALSAHLSEQGMRTPRRFELDSYRAMLAMVAGGTGWTILTVLGAQHAGRYASEIDVHPLPVAPLSRQLSLFAHTDGMPDMAEDIAVRLRPLIQTRVVAPALQTWPWLADQIGLTAP